MRICQVVDYYDLGQGGGPFAYCRTLADRGHDVVLLAPSRAAAADEIRRGGVTCAFVPYPRRGNPLQFLWSSWAHLEDRFRALDRRRDFDAVVFHHPLTAFQLLSRGLMRGRGVVYFFHSPWSVEWLLNARAAGPASAESGVRSGLQMEARRRIEDLNLRHAHGVVSLSEYMRRQLFRHHPGFPARRTRIIPGGVDPEVFHPASDRRALRVALRLPVERRILFTLRRLVPRMGLFNLLGAFQRVRARCPDAFLVVGGTGPLRESLETAARDMGLADSVMFLGYVSEMDVPRLYQAADLFVLPTMELEGFGFVTIEALACGLPVVATPVGGTLEVLGGFDRGCLTRGTDAEALAERIEEVLRDPARMSEAYRARCRAHAVGRYAWSRVAEQVEGVLQEVVAGAGRGGGRAAPTARRVRDANRAIYNAKDFDDYERNESIFSETRQGEIEARLAELSRQSKVQGPESGVHEPVAATVATLDCGPGISNSRGQAAGRLLDLGCGTGNIVRRARAHFRWAGGLDIGWRLLGQARRRRPDLPLVGGETERLPFRDGAFGCVTGYAVLHHLLDPRPTFREAWRVLAPGGVLYTDHDVNYRFARFYQPVYRIAHLRRAGFSGPEEDLAEYHNTRTAGLDPEALAEALRAIGFREVRVEYWHTQNPALSVPRRAALAILKSLAAAMGWRSFYTHFRIVARK